MYNKIITKFREFSKILENKEQALSILKKRHLPNDHPDYLAIRKQLENTFNNLNYLGLMIKFRFMDVVSMDEIFDLIRWLRDGSPKKLPKNILQYDNFEELKDDIVIINNEHRFKVIYNELPKAQKDLVNASEDNMEEFKKWAITVHNIKTYPMLFKKISKEKDFESLIDRMKRFVEENSDIESYTEKIQNIKNRDDAILVYQNDDTGIIVAEILKYGASKELGSGDWCISTGRGSWDSYVYQKDNKQYFIWDYSKTIADNDFMIGITVNKGSEIVNAHDKYDKGILSNLPDYIKTLNKQRIIRGLTDKEYAEFLKRKVQEEHERNTQEREDAKAAYDEDDNLVEMGEALIEFLDYNEEWNDELDLYDVRPSDYDHYGLNIFDVPYIDKHRQYAITDDEYVADRAAESYVRDFIDDIGPTSINGWENFLDSDEVVNYIGYDYDYVSESPDSYGVERTITVEGERELERLDKLKDKFENLEEKAKDKLALYEKWGSEREEKFDNIIAELEDSAEVDEVRLAKIKSLKDKFMERFNRNVARYEKMIEKYEEEWGEADDAYDEVNDENNDHYWEYDDDEIEAKVEELNDEIREEPVGRLEELGYIYNGSIESGYKDLFERLVDYDELAKYVVRSDGRGPSISGYDGEEYDISYNDKTFYIYRLN